jgi:hypothetical protein
MSERLENGLDGVPDLDIAPRMHRVFSLLLDAYEYAAQLDRTRWDFAVEVRELCSVGLTSSDFRWLVCKGYVEHGREITPLEEDGRVFQRVGNLTLTKKTCVVLTQVGAAFARKLLREPSAICPRGFAAATVRKPGMSPAPALAPIMPLNPVPPLFAQATAPSWDRDRQELRFGGLIVKQFKVPAPNQEVILAAFEEEHWPARIDDPLPVHPCLESKRRLHETITSLNRNQKNRLIQFMGDGSGQGVRWEPIPLASERNGSD